MLTVPSIVTTPVASMRIAPPPLPPSVFESPRPPPLPGISGSSATPYKGPDCGAVRLPMGQPPRPP